MARTASADFSSAFGVAARLPATTPLRDGEAAVSIGYGRRFGDNVSVSLGAAFSNSESAAGVGFGIDL